MIATAVVMTTQERRTENGRGMRKTTYVPAISRAQPVPAAARTSSGMKADLFMFPPLCARFLNADGQGTVLDLRGQRQVPRQRVAGAVGYGDDLHVVADTIGYDLG